MGVIFMTHLNDEPTNSRKAKGERIKKEFNELYEKEHAEKLEREGEVVPQNRMPFVFKFLFFLAIVVVIFVIVIVVIGFVDLEFFRGLF